GVHALVEFVVYVLAYVERAVPAGEQESEAAEDVPHPAFGEVDDASVDHDVRVRTVEAEEVREPRHRHADIRACVALPMFVQVDAVASRDRHRGQEFRGLEPGPVDDDVDVVRDAVDGDNAGRRDLAYRVGDELDVLALQRARPYAV